VIAAPKIIDAKVTNDPNASVDTPVTPCPMVQPRDNTHPTPISTAPTTCLKKSDLEANHSILKLFDIIA
jgi:hypothetical protein